MNQIDISTQIPMIEKVDMVSLKIYSPLSQEILSLFEDVSFRRGHGIIKVEGKSSMLFLSCVDSRARDELYEVLRKKLSH